MFFEICSSFFPAPFPSITSLSLSYICNVWSLRNVTKSGSTCLSRITSLIFICSLVFLKELCSLECSPVLFWLSWAWAVAERWSSFSWGPVPLDPDIMPLSVPFNMPFANWPMLKDWMSALEGSLKRIFGRVPLAWRLGMLTCKLLIYASSCWLKVEIVSLCCVSDWTWSFRFSIWICRLSCSSSFWCLLYWSWWSRCCFSISIWLPSSCTCCDCCASSSSLRCLRLICSWISELSLWMICSLSSSFSLSSWYFWF